MRGESALLFFEPGHMSIAKQSDAIRREADNSVDGMSESIRGLIREAVNQVHVDTVEAKIPRSLNQVASDFVRLNAVDRVLHGLVEILNAHAEPIEAQAAQGLKVLS